MKTLPFCITILLIILTSFYSKVQQKHILSYYRPDIGMFIHYNKKEGKKKIGYKENWDFYFTLKNDSVAIIQDIKKKNLFKSREYRLSNNVDTGYVKRHLNGKHYKTEKFHFKKIEM